MNSAADGIRPDRQNWSGRRERFSAARKEKECRTRIKAAVIREQNRMIYPEDAAFGADGFREDRAQDRAVWQRFCVCLLFYAYVS